MEEALVKERRKRVFLVLPSILFFPCVKIHLSLADLFNVSCTTAVCCSAGVFSRCSTRDFFASLAAGLVRKGEG